MLLTRSLADKLAFTNTTFQVELRPVVCLNGVSVVVLGTRRDQVAIEIRRMIALLRCLALLATFFLIYFGHRLYVRVVLWGDYGAWTASIRDQSAQLRLLSRRCFLDGRVLPVV